MVRKTRRAGNHRKEVRKEQRIAARITQELYDVLQDRAYRENKTGSVIMVEALIQYLDFKMPPLKK